MLENKDIKIILNIPTIGEILLETKKFGVPRSRLSVSQMAPINNRYMITRLTQQIFINIYYVYDIILGTREIRNRQKFLT